MERKESQLPAQQPAVPAGAPGALSGKIMGLKFMRRAAERVQAAAEPEVRRSVLSALLLLSQVFLSLRK